jgi:hypothetical protein
MDRDHAIEVMDALISSGYRVCLYGAPTDSHNLTPSYWVSIKELGVDKIDLKHLAALADELDLDVGLHSTSGGEITFVDKSVIPAVIRNPRRHPR